MSVTITLYLWWLWVYLAIGAVLWLPLEWLAWRSAQSTEPFWAMLRRLVVRRPLRVILPIVAWPLAVWEEVR